jgi:hypothetical protein
MPIEQWGSQRAGFWRYFGSAANVLAVLLSEYRRAVVAERRYEDLRRTDAQYHEALPNSRLEQLDAGHMAPANAPISSTRSCGRFWTSRAERLGAPAGRKSATYEFTPEQPSRTGAFHRRLGRREASEAIDRMDERPTRL